MALRRGRQIVWFNSLGPMAGRVIGLVSREALGIWTVLS